jgi:hypothetical protein
VQEGIVGRIVRKWVPVFIASGVGIFALAGYLFPRTILSDYRDRLVEWAVIIAAFAVILGLFNLLRVHGRRIGKLADGWEYSLVLLLAAALFWVPSVLQGPSGAATQMLLEYVIAPVGASLAALVVFTLTLAALRLLRQRWNVSSLLFVLVVALSLLGSTPILGFNWLSDVRDWLIGVPGMAGMRGLLLGVALGTVITGLRVLMGSDRPHSEF